MTVAFVAGATGFVGRAVVDALRLRGVTTVAHVRPTSPRLAEWRDRWQAAGVEVEATPWEAPALVAALRSRQVTHVFSLLGTTRKQARSEGMKGDPYEAVDYGLTRLLCEAAVASERRPRFVLLSSVGVGPGSRAGYLRAHWKAEEVVRGSGLPWVIARPSFIVPGGGGAQRDDARPLEKATAVVADGLLAAVGLVAARTRDRYRSITPETLAAALVKAGLDGAPDRIVEGAELR
jgi:uncharacterized protein YbjT (DUF2867 family)